MTLWDPAAAPDRPLQKTYPFIQSNKMCCLYTKSDTANSAIELSFFPYVNQKNYVKQQVQKNSLEQKKQPQLTMFIPEPHSHHIEVNSLSWEKLQCCTQVFTRKVLNQEPKKENYREKFILWLLLHLSKAGKPRREVGVGSLYLESYRNCQTQKLFNHLTSSSDRV